jgi:hypothetical protein
MASTDESDATLPVAWITVGTSGLGLAAARRFSNAGYACVLMARDETRGVEAARLIPKATFVALDVSAADACERTLKNVLSKFGAPRVVLHAAGVLVRETLPESTPRSVAAVMGPSFDGQRPSRGASENVRGGRRLRRLDRVVFGRSRRRGSDARLQRLESGAPRAHEVARGPLRAERRPRQRDPAGLHRDADQPRRVQEREGPRGRTRRVRFALPPSKATKKKRSATRGTRVLNRGRTAKLELVRIDAASVPPQNGAARLLSTFATRKRFAFFLRREPAVEHEFDAGDPRRSLRGEK